MPDKSDLKRMINLVMNGNEILVEDPKLVRYFARMVGRNNRKNVFIGRDRGYTLIKIIDRGAIYHSPFEKQMRR